MLNIDTYEKYHELVEQENYQYAVENPIVPVPEKFVNDNGMIQNLALGKFASAAYISSKMYSVRANHYHKTDWHYSYVICGKIAYFWRPTGTTELPKLKIITNSGMFFTPPMVDHAMVFLQPTTFITTSRNLRDTGHHEQDVERISFISIDKTEHECVVKYKNNVLLMDQLYHQYCNCND